LHKQQAQTSAMRDWILLGLTGKALFLFGVPRWRCCRFVPLARSVQFEIETLTLYLGFKKQMEHHTDLFQPSCFANVLLELPLLYSCRATDRLQWGCSAWDPLQKRAASNPWYRKSLTSNCAWDSGEYCLLLWNNLCP